MPTLEETSMVIDIEMYLVLAESIWFTAADDYYCHQYIHRHAAVNTQDMLLLYIYILIRCFYPKRLTCMHSGYTCFFVSICVPWELNPQLFALLTECSTTEPQEHCTHICEHRNTYMRITSQQRRQKKWKAQYITLSVRKQTSASADMHVSTHRMTVNRTG